MNTRLFWMISPVCLTLGFAAGYLQPLDLQTADTTPSSTGATAAAVANDHASSAKPAWVDLVDAMSQATSYPSQLHRENALAELLAQLSPGEFSPAVEAALRLPKEERAEVLRELYTYWAEHDPAAACQHALQNDVSETGVMEASLQIWMRKDAAVVLAWSRQLSARDRRRMSWQGLQAAMALGKDAPEAAAALIIEFAKHHGGAVERISEFFNSWSSRDPHKAAEEAMGIRVARMRGPGIQAVAESWAERDPHTALAWLANVQDERTRRQAEARVLGAWAEQDADTATAYALKIPDETVRNAALAQIAKGLLEKDPQAASALADNLPLDLLKNSDFYLRWSEKNPEAATSAHIRRFAELDPESRRHYADELARVFRSWSEATPQTAAEFATSQPEGAREVLIEQATQSWVNKDRAAALKWGASLPEGPARETAFRTLAASWAWYSTNEVAAWLQSLPPGTSREAAVTGFANTAIRTDAEGALSWLRTIPEPQRSADALGEAWRGWVNEGGLSTAMRWLKETRAITPLERATLERMERSLWVE